MKKILLGTTALVAAGVIGAGDARAEFEMTVGGYFGTAYGFVDEDDGETGVLLDTDGDGVGDTEALESGNRRQNQALNQDAEVHFKFAQTLDNGIEVGGRFELEGFQSGDQIDERWIFFRGGFGELRAGDEDDARKLKSYAAPEASGMFGVNSPYFTFNNLANLGQVVSTNTTFPNLENDSSKIIYFTPSFGGFQLAASYAPDSTQDRTGFGTGSTDDGGISNAMSVGADYSGEFGGVSIGVGGGYSQGSVEAGSGDPSIWAVGLNLGFGGFTVGGSVAFVDADTGGDDEATVFDVGATYNFDAVTVGVGYSHGEYDDEGDTDELDHAQITAGYAMGPGVTLGAMLGWFSYEDEGPSDNDNEGWQTGVGAFFNL
jgi:hypothetical protein